jgi:probable rRNA maturation factor
MRLIVDIEDETNKLDPEMLIEVRSLLDFAALYETVNEGTELSVTFVDNKRIQEINREYRDKDTPTDVISFALEDRGEGETEIIGGEVPRHLGDIIISVPKAIEQAAEYEHSLKRELGFLAVHGFLHLLGYDHMNDDDEQVMFSKQTEILTKYGLVR